MLVSPGRRIGREAACEALFPNLSDGSAANALRRALSMAKAALSPLGEEAAGLLCADRGRIFVSADLVVEVDSELHSEMLRKALAMAPGAGRDELLCLALGEGGTLLEDEPYADWALRPRERLEALRQEARLALACDRARGAGRSCPKAVIEAWESCLEHDPACEEAAAALIVGVGVCVPVGVGVAEATTTHAPFRQNAVSVSLNCPLGVISQGRPLLPGLI